MLIQYALLAGVLGMLVVFVRSQNGVRLRAGKRLGFFAFLFLNAYAVLRPGDVSRVGRFFGVGRGTDMLLYILIVTFVFVVLNFYQRLQESERRLTDLARAVAVTQAEELNRSRGVIVDER